MRTLRIISIIVALGYALQSGNVKAQMSDYKFNQLFDIAFAQIVEGDLEKARTTLEKLNQADPNHGQVGFLLGMCDVKTGHVTSNTQMVLANAAVNYDYFHQRGRVEDQSAPAKVWLYLAQARTELGFFDAAVTAYRNYMSCIPLATIEHKREVVAEIKRLKAQQVLAAGTTAGLTVNSKP